MQNTQSDLPRYSRIGPGPRLLILADDLSGAADCGVACTHAGLDTMVFLALPTQAAGADTWAVDIDSRGLDAAGAAEVTQHAAAALLGLGTVLYKKIDSTLRGHPAAEIASARSALTDVIGREPLAIVAPAFPALGRTMRDGQVLVHGTPLEGTEIWRHEPAGASADLAAILQSAGVPTRRLGLDAVRGGGLGLALREAPGAVLCDAETEADLAAVARAGAGLGAGVLWAGSAGLARHVAAMLAGSAVDGSRPGGPAVKPRDGPVAVVTGSLSTVARTQMARVSARAGCASVVLSVDDLMADGAFSGLRARLEEAIASAGSGGLVAVSIGASDGQPARGLSTSLGRLVAPCLERFAGLIVSGGETARAVLGQAGITGLHLVGELSPGVPLSVAADGAAAGLPVVTKAGAFGHEGTLESGAAALHAFSRAGASVLATAAATGGR